MEVGDSGARSLPEWSVLWLHDMCSKERPLVTLTSKGVQNHRRSAISRFTNCRTAECRSWTLGVQGAPRLTSVDSDIRPM